MDCSTMIRCVAIWSVHDLSLRKPAWCFQSLASTPVFSLSKITLLRSFPGTDRSILAYRLSLGASRGTLLSIPLVFLLVSISSRIGNALSLWRSLCQP